MKRLAQGYRILYVPFYSYEKKIHLACFLDEHRDKPPALQRETGWGVGFYDPVAITVAGRELPYYNVVHFEIDQC